MTADGIIFDIDGTLWDSTEVIAARWNQLFAGEADLCGLRITGDDLKKLFGKLLKEIGEILFQDARPPARKSFWKNATGRRKRFCEAIRPLPTREFRKQSKPLPGVFRFLLSATVRAAILNFFWKLPVLAPSFPGTSVREIRACPKQTISAFFPSASV